MICPVCNSEMEAGDVYLKAWGLGIAPQAYLNFGDERLWTNNYIPVVGLFDKGSRREGYRCEKCRFVGFKYPE